MRFTARTLEELIRELEQALDAPGEPRPVYACATAQMPPAAAYPNGVLRNTTLNILAVSDGINWIRQDTGAAI
jgi:hypothetical protein